MWIGEPVRESEGIGGWKVTINIYKSIQDGLLLILVNIDNGWRDLLSYGGEWLCENQWVKCVGTVRVCGNRQVCQRKLKEYVGSESVWGGVMNELMSLLETVNLSFKTKLIFYEESENFGNLYIKTFPVFNVRTWITAFRCFYHFWHNINLSYIPLLAHCQFHLITCYDINQFFI